MKGLLKRFFKKEPRVLELKKPQLQQWLDTKVDNVGLKRYSEEYFKRIATIKDDINNKVVILQEQEISEKDQKQVEMRVQNIVKGQREHYAREVLRFAQNLQPLENQSNSLVAYQEVIAFNEDLNNKLEVLAKNTQKSYQASQHLFFEQVEPVFKLLGELNLLVKDLAKEVEKKNILGLQEIQDLITNMQRQQEVFNQLDLQIKEKESQLQALEREKEKIDDQIHLLKASEEYKRFQQLQRDKKELEQKRNDLDNQIFSFFSKLQKPLKKYERIALDNTVIILYLEDALAAFKNDTQLKITRVLEDLVGNLKSLNFEEKQISNFTHLIASKNLKSLRELHESILAQESEVNLKIQENSTPQVLQKAEVLLSNKETKIREEQLQITDLKERKSKLLMGDNPIMEAKIKEVLGIRVTISS